MKVRNSEVTTFNLLTPHSYIFQNISSQERGSPSSGQWSICKLIKQHKFKWQWLEKNNPCLQYNFQNNIAIINVSRNAEIKINTSFIQRFSYPKISHENNYFLSIEAFIIFFFKEYWKVRNPNTKCSSFLPWSYGFEFTVS